MSKSIKLPNFKELSLNTLSYEDSFLDNQEIESLNSTMIKLLLNLKEYNREITSYSRKLAKLELEYEMGYVKSIWKIWIRQSRSLNADI